MTKNIDTTEQINEIFNLALNWFCDYALGNDVPEDRKAELTKRAFKIRPPVKNIMLSITRNNKEHSQKLYIKYERTEYPQHKGWHRDVLKRDNFKCTICNRNANLHVHHIKSWKDYPDLRFDINNGLTLCLSCHWKVHNKTIKLTQRKLGRLLKVTQTLITDRKQANG